MLRCSEIYLEQSEVVAALMPDLYDRVAGSLGVVNWWCISKPLAKALEVFEGQVVSIDGFGCWWALPYVSAATKPEETLQQLGLISFLA